MEHGVQTQAQNPPGWEMGNQNAAYRCNSHSSPAGGEGAGSLVISYTEREGRAAGKHRPLGGKPKDQIQA